MPARLVSTPDMKRKWSRDRLALMLEEALGSALEVGVIAALMGIVAMLYARGVLG